MIHLYVWNSTCSTVLSRRIPSAESEGHSDAFFDQIQYSGLTDDAPVSAKGMSLFRSVRIVRN